jgi:hypothetical protein
LCITQILAGDAVASEICHRNETFQLARDAAVPIITGIFTDEYGCVRPWAVLNFHSRHYYYCHGQPYGHSIPVETAIAHKIDFPQQTGGLQSGAAVLVAYLSDGWGVFL